MASISSPADSSTTSQWALVQLKAEAVWRITQGNNETVAVIDTGVNANKVLASNVLSGADFSDTTGKDIGNGLSDTDSLGHGTGEASLIAGPKSAAGTATVGLAPSAKILPIRASDGSDSRWLFGVAPSIEYAITHKSKVISLAIALNFDDSDTRKAVQHALDCDIVVVAAVGNDGTSQQFYPAAWPGVVGVGAVDSSGRVWERSNRGADVALVAPGVHILRDDNRGRVGYSDGTSEATAYVSAAAALVRSAHPGWSAAEVVAALEATADKPAEMRGAARDDRYGAGILDVLAAVSLVKPPVVGGAGGEAGPAHGGGDSGFGGSWWLAGLGVVGVVGIVGAVVVLRQRRHVGGPG